MFSNEICKNILKSLERISYKSIRSSQQKPIIIIRFKRLGTGMPLLASRSLMKQGVK